MQNHAAEIKLRAERKAGELLAVSLIHGGDRRSSSRDKNLKLADLADLGIDHNQCARWQREAAVPDQEFERYLATVKAAKKEVSAAGLLQLAKKLGLSGPHLKHTAAGQKARGGGVARRGHGKAKGGGRGTSTAQPAVRNTAQPAVRNTAANRGHRRGKNAEQPADDEESLPSDLIREAKNHLDLLAKILAPICAAGKTELRKAEREHVPRLLAETRRLLDEVLRKR
jgi:hypothetical protein